MEGGERVRDRCVGLEGWMGCAHGGWGARAAHPSSISACSCPSVDDREEAGDVDPCSTGSQQKLEPGSALYLHNASHDVNDDVQQPHANAGGATCSARTGLRILRTHAPLVIYYQ